MELGYSSISASGRLNPILRLDFGARAVGAAKSVFINDLGIELRYQRELIGRGKFSPDIISANNHSCYVSIPLTYRSLDFITNSLPDNVSSLGLDLTFTGSILMEENLDYQYRHQMPKLEESYLIPVSEQSSGQLTIERSTWYSSVLAPTRHESFHYLEVALPNSLNQSDLNQEFLTGLNHLREAEKSYVQGNDDNVFHRLRGWLDSLPGAKKEFLSRIADEDKHKHLNAILDSFGKYLHDGRHA